MTGYLVGVDVGGTFTDCAVVDSAGTLRTAKALTTPENQSAGFLAAVSAAARSLGISTAELLGNTDRLVHGTTMGINAVLTRSGPPVGLITTRGHGEALFIMNGTGRTAGLAPEDVVDYPDSSLPRPLIDPSMVIEVTQRVDRHGRVVVPLDLPQARAAVEVLRSRGAKAIAVVFLWSFLDPSHERLVKELIERMAPEIFVSLSSEVAPKLGEYPRTATAVMNAYIGPAFRAYADALADAVAGAGLARGVAYAQCNGGIMTRDAARSVPVNTLESGPAMGIVGSAYLGSLMGHPNIICTDMGGTTFDVGLVVRGLPMTREDSIVDRHQLHLSMVDVESIGAGGGSVVWIDSTGGIRVGPASAGARPGPACYGRGGEQATVTDADVVRGIVDPDGFLGGEMRLDAEAARRAVGRIAERAGLGLYETAAGITRIVDSHMADLVRRMSLYRGYDPRDFVVYAFGGAGPVHAGLYARALGIRTVVVPLANAASVWSALGATCAQLSVAFDRAAIERAPFDAARVDTVFRELEAAAARRLAKEGVAPARRDFRRSAFMKFTGQVFELEIEVPAGPLAAAQMEELLERFTARYEQRYGAGTSYRDAGITLTLLRVTGLGLGTRPGLAKLAAADRSTPPAARTRPVYWAETAALVDTPVHAGAALRPGHRVDGPAVLEFPHTTVALHPGHRARIDDFGNVVISLDGEAGEDR